MLWSRIAKARLLDIARTVFGIAWASARAQDQEARARRGDGGRVRGGRHAGRPQRRDARRGAGLDAAEAAAGPEAEPAETAADPVDATARDRGDGSGGNGHAAPADDGAGQADPGDPGVEAADAADGAGDGPMPPAPVNGHDPAGDPMAIPEFLRRVH